MNRIRLVYVWVRSVSESYTSRIRLYTNGIRLVYGWFRFGPVFKISKKAADPSGGARPPARGIAKIQHSAPTYLWSYLGDCQNSAFVPDWYSSRIRSHTHWHARNPVERIAQMEFSVERFAQLGISVERVAQLGISVERIAQLGISVERAWLRA